MTSNSTILGTAAALAILSAGPGAARELTLGMQDNEVSNVYAGVQEFGARLADLSGGEMTVNIFPSSALGDFKAMVPQVQAGELDMVMTGYPDMSYMIPELALIGAPYVVTDFADLQSIVEGPWGQEMEAKVEAQGLTMLDLWYYGTRQTTANRPIEGIKDMAGLRMRTPNVPFLIAYAENTGATAAPVAFAEVYLALQTNQVDAQENPLPTIDAMKFYEVQDHVAMTNHFVASSAIWINSDTLAGFSDEERGWLQEAIEAGGDLSDERTFQAEEDLIATFKERGLTVTEPDLAPFREAMQPYYDTLEAEFGEGSIAALRGN